MTTENTNNTNHMIAFNILMQHCSNSKKDSVEIIEQALLLLNQQCLTQHSSSKQAELGLTQHSSSKQIEFGLTQHSLNQFEIMTLFQKLLPDLHDGGNWADRVLNCLLENFKNRSDFQNIIAWMLFETTSSRKTSVFINKLLLSYYQPMIDAVKARDEEKRIIEEARVAEEKRIADEAKVAEEKRIAEEAKIVEEKRVAEEKSVAEEKRVANEAMRKMGINFRFVCGNNGHVSTIIVLSNRTTDLIAKEIEQLIIFKEGSCRISSHYICWEDCSFSTKWWFGFSTETKFKYISVNLVEMTLKASLDGIRQIVLANLAYQE